MERNGVFIEPSLVSFWKMDKLHGRGRWLRVVSVCELKYQWC
jgi:hypothetical protein